METPKKANDSSINSKEIGQSKLFSDKMFEKAKFYSFKTFILKQITKNLKVLIKNKLIWNKTVLIEKSSDEICRKEISMLREELKIKNLFFNDLLQIIKEVKIKSITV